MPAFFADASTRAICLSAFSIAARASGPGLVLPVVHFGDVQQQQIRLRCFDQVERDVGERLVLYPGLFLPRWAFCAFFSCRRPELNSALRECSANQVDACTLRLALRGYSQQKHHNRRAHCRCFLHGVGEPYLSQASQRNSQTSRACPPNRGKGDLRLTREGHRRMILLKGTIKIVDSG